MHIDHIKYPGSLYLSYREQEQQIRRNLCSVVRLRPILYELLIVVMFDLYMFFKPEDPVKNQPLR